MDYSECWELEKRFFASNKVNGIILHLKKNIKICPEAKKRGARTEEINEKNKKINELEAEVKRQKSLIARLESRLLLKFITLVGC